MKEFNCLFCGAQEFDTVKDKLRGGVTNIHTVKCKSCGLEQLYPLPSIEEDKEYYDRNVHDKGITPEFSIEEIFEKFKFQNESRIRYLKEFGIKNVWKMADMASGYGFFIQMMRNEGFSFDGIEISRERLDICKSRIPDAKIHVFNLQMEDAPSDLKECYDLVTMFHLLEHLVEPVLFLKRLREIIKPNGYLVVELPNVKTIMMEASKEFNDFFYFRDHVAYYTPELMVSALEKAGYSVIKVSGNQLYGLTNHYNWIINGTPELKKPSYETCDSMKWLEKIYKERLDLEVKSEYMYAIARKTNVQEMGRINHGQDNNSNYTS